MLRSVGAFHTIAHDSPLTSHIILKEAEISRIGIDVGGTKILAVLLDDQGRVERQHRLPVSLDRDKLLSQLAGVVQDFGGDGPVGIGVPGPVTREGVVAAAPNLAAVVGLTAADLTEAIGRPALLANDAKCAALAESRLGAGRGLDDFLLVAFGTGIGAAIWADRHLVLGQSGFAGEVGHMIIDPSGPECPCGQRGCWERVASGTALDLRARQGVREGWIPRNADEPPTGKTVVEAARQGRAQAVESIDAYSEWVALGLVSLINVFDPGAIVYSGGLTGAADVLLPRITDHVERLWNGFGARSVPPIKVAELGSQAGAIGAALLEE